MALSPNLAGILCVSGATAIFSLQDALIKLVSGIFPLHEIIFVRSIVALGLTLVIVRFEGGGFTGLRSKHPWLNLLRALLVVACNMFFFLALAALPIADAAAVFFISPILITALSIPILGEKVGPWRWFAIFAGLAGVLVMLRPGGDGWNLVALLPAVAALCYALMQMLTRRIGLADKASTLAFYVQATFVVGTSLFGLVAGDGKFAGSDDPSLDFLLRAWRLPGSGEALLLVSCGVMSAAGSWLVSQGYRIAAAASVAPFEYTALALSVVWGLLFWGDLPDVYTVTGMLLIAGSGLLVIWRENVRATVLASRRPMPRNR